MISKGEFTYKVGGEDVKVEDFYKQLLETNGDVHINELEMNLVPKNTPFFMDEVIDSPECNEYWRTDSTVGSIYEKLQNTSFEDAVGQLTDNQNSNLEEKKEFKRVENKILSEGQCTTPTRTQEQKEKIQEPAGKKESQIGIKKSEGKLHYELSWEFIEEMAKRMANNKSNEYPLYNWKLPMDIQKLKDAINRHHIEVMKGNYKDGDEPLGHIVQYACNSMMLWHQLSSINK